MRKHSASKSRGTPVEPGIVLADPSGKLVGYGRGGEVLLDDPKHRGPESGELLAKEIVEILTTVRSSDSADPASKRIRIRRGASEYSCRTYLVEPQNEFPAQPIVAILLERDGSEREEIREAAARYHLTNREQQVLRCVLDGLTNEQMVQEMQVSPNTLKAFLRLVMLKMHVKSRTAMVAMALGRRPAPERGAA
jgi:DNA-binding CsgD family transcriptional regulator